MHSDLTEGIRQLPGPILVVGANGFLGANLLRALLAVRKDVYGTQHGCRAWRLEGISADHLLFMDLLSDMSQRQTIDRVAPAVVFDCSAFGAYSFEQDTDRIHRTNYNALVQFLELLTEREVQAYVHSGSSSEYGLNSNAPSEDDRLVPDSQYAVSKAAAAQALMYYGKVRKLPCVNLRLYSLYGPYEDSSRLIPVLADHVIRGGLPPLVDPEVSRDFVHVRDAVRAFVRAAMYLRPKHYGESYNVGTGTRTTIRQLAELAVRQFGLDQAPEFGTMPGRSWDRTDWVADPRRFESAFGWKAELSLADGLGETVAWWREFLKDHDLAGLTKKQQHPAKSSVSAVIACYKDGQAIPIMYDRLRKTFEQEGVDYEIIFVNDCSPDDSTEAIRKLTEADANVIGIVHSRNFGSQAAFRSGMEVASKEACVLLDGDLQDPPELISEFIAKWRDGADVVYGRRVHREMPFWREWCYKGFYRLFAWLGEIPIPRDAGDFSLLDWRVVQHLLSCQERDYFLRGLRAYVGFRQEGVDYVRPERAFGVSTNNWAKNIGWAKKGILAFSRTPLQSITVIGSLAILAIVLFSLYLIVGKLLFPQIAPKGVTMGYLLTMALGAANLFALGVLGEYIGKIIEESKGRPPFIRAARIQHGDVIEWS